MLNIISLILAVIIFLTSRPSLLGQNYAVVSVFSSFALLLIILFQRIKINTKLIYYNLIFIIFCSFLIISSFYGDGNSSVVLKTVLSFIFPILVFSLFLTYRDNAKKFLYILCWITSLIGISSLITILLQLLGKDNILLFQFSINEYPNAGLVYFPFTISSGAFSSLDLIVLRTSGYMREPGIFHAFALICLFLNETFFNRTFFRLGCFLALVFTFSTTGYALFLVSLSLYFYSNFRSKLLGLFCLISTCVSSILLFLFLPGIGYYDKLRTHGESIKERGGAATQGLQAFFDNPFGIGYLSNVNNSMGNINIVASLGQIGIIGFVLILIMFSYPLFIVNMKQRLNYLTIFSPVFLTAIFAQPIYDSPATYFCIMSWFYISSQVVNFHYKIETLKL